MAGFTKINVKTHKKSNNNNNVSFFLFRKDRIIYKTIIIIIYIFVKSIVSLTNIVFQSMLFEIIANLKKKV